MSEGYFLFIVNLKLRTKSHTTLKCESFTVEVIEVGMCKLNAYTTDFKLGITKMSCRRHLYVCLECFGICILEVLKLCCPSKRTNYVCVDTVLCPFCSSNSGKTADTLFSSCVRTLTVVTEKTCTGCEVDDRSLCFLKVRIASLHIIERCIKT